MTEALHYLSLTEASGRVASGETSSVALTEAQLARIEALEGALHSYIRVEADEALAAARAADAEIASGRRRGPLHGVPIAIKDICLTKGAPATFGSRAYAGTVGDEDATVVGNLKAAGAVILGRLHLHEGAFGEHHADWDRPANPWGAAWWPGGSSSGSGVATAAGLCYGSLGTDTGGSVRFPCGACGLSGVKVTWGRVSRHGVFALSDSLDTIGPMARSAADCAALMTAFAGYDPKDPTSLRAPVPDYPAMLSGVGGARGLRIAVDLDDLEAACDPEVFAVAKAAAERFAELGATLVPWETPDVQAAAEAQLPIMKTECAQWHEARFAERPGDFGVLLSGAIRDGLAMSPVELARAYIARDRFKGALAATWEIADAILVPVMPMVGVRYDDFDAFFADLPKALRFTSPYNLSGSPAAIACGGFARNGLPIGFQLVGPHLSEGALLRAMHAYQQTTDHHLKRPPVG
jgi:amidase